MNSNTLPLQDSDLDLVTKAIELLYIQGLTSNTVNTVEMQRLHELSEQLWHAQAQREAAGPVYEKALERYLLARGQTA